MRRRLGLHPGAGEEPPTPPPRGGGWLAGRIVSAAEPEVVVTVFFNDSGVGFVECTRAVFGSAEDVRAKRAFFPPLAIFTET